MKDYVVSFFNNVLDTTPKDFSLLEWIQLTMNPSKQYRAIVEKYQESMLRKDKEKIPCITIHAAFKNHREEANIKHKNKLISIDIDRTPKNKKRKGNICIDMQMAKDFISKHPSTFFCAFSASGSEHGCYAIIMIDDEEDLLGYFEHFRKSFARLGINIDESCKDYARLRFFSIDEEAYFNPDAKPFKRSLTEEEERYGNKAPVYDIRMETLKTHFARTTNYEKAVSIVELAEIQGVDITANYDDWVKVGAALAREFGEDGRSLFHRLSNKHPEYKATAADKKFDSCKKMNKVNFDSLFYVASSYGIKY